MKNGKVTAQDIRKKTTMIIIKKVGRASKSKEKQCGQVYLPAEWAGKVVRVQLL